jgi:hypothetical protein
VVDQSKLLELLELTWESPVFGDSYAVTKEVGGGSVMQRVARMHTLLVARLRPILAEWMQPITDHEIDEIIRQIAPKSTAFCSAIAAGELDDVERLSQAGLSIALVYWIDHGMDRGDMAMEAAIRRRVGRPTGADDLALEQASANLIPTRSIGLGALEQIISAFCRPEDAAVLVDNVLHEVLYREVRMRELSRLYERSNQKRFWSDYMHESAEHAILNVALVYVTAAIYAIHRQHTPRLPSLAEIFAEPAVMRLMNGPAAAMIRVLDDLGDRAIDSGEDPRWGHFTLNIFNQSHPDWLDAFMHVAGLHDRQAAQSLIDAFHDDDSSSREYIFRTFVDFARTEFAALSAGTYQAYRLFLNLGKRVLEAGYVNAIGDIELTG